MGRADARGERLAADGFASFETPALRAPQDDDGLVWSLRKIVILRSAPRARLEGRTVGYATCSMVMTSPAKVVRRTSRTSLRSKRRARCMVWRLSHITRSLSRQECE